jgi:chaperone modulatory protein CbpM
MTRESDLPQSDAIVPDEMTELALADFCRVCAVRTEFVVELVDEGVLVPAGPEPERWSFTVTHVRRAQVASRLQRDLGVNLAGAALALELLAEIEALRTRLAVLGGD